MTWHRRAAMIGLSATLAAGYVAAVRSWRPRLRYEPIAGLPGFRRVIQGAPASRPGQSSFDAIFTGLMPADAPRDDPGVAAEVAADPCGALFGGAAQPAIAYFTDMRCPICRLLERDLDRLAADGHAPVTHEFPVFGAGSELAARVLVAAGPSLAPRLRARLTAAPVVVTQGYLRAVLADLGADPAPILDAAFSAPVEATLARSRMLAQALGFVGTPGLVIGGTAMLGALPLADLRDILAAERDRPLPCGR